MKELAISEMHIASRGVMLSVEDTLYLEPLRMPMLQQQAKLKYKLLLSKYVLEEMEFDESLRRIKSPLSTQRDEAHTTRWSSNSGTDYKAPGVPKSSPNGRLEEGAAREYHL
jgi:hypothetical protein